MTRNQKVALAASGLALALGVLSALDARGFRRCRRLDTEIAALKERQRVFQAENEALRREIAALSGDNKALERAAREDLGLVRSNEVVFTFEH
jgi:cell division protein FtsB